MRKHNISTLYIIKSVEFGGRRVELERQKMRRWDVGKVGKDNDNDKEETTIAPLNFSASHPLIFQKGEFYGGKSKAGN